MENLTLSYSSSNLLLGCEQKYWHYKVNQTPIDIDADVNTKAFSLGKAFHDILENSNHEKPKSMSLELEKVKALYDLEDEDLPILHAMILKYLRGIKDDGFEVVKCELQVTDEFTLGFIDLIIKDKEGAWWIVDLKTAKTFYATKKSSLTRDRQLNLYASFAPRIAPFLNLEAHKFKGCRYRVTTKPSLKQKKTESEVDYILRLADSAKFIEVIIPIEKMIPDETYEEHRRLHARAKELHQGSAPTKNYNYCETYFKPCEYWSNCHGACFTSIDLEVKEC